MLCLDFFQFRIQQGDVFRSNGSQIAAATRLASSLKEAVDYQLYVASFRKRNTFFDILTPRQAILYQEWLLSNRDRTKKVQVLNERKRLSTSTTGGMDLSPESDRTRDENLTLEKLCLHLEESLKVSKNQSC